MGLFWNWGNKNEPKYSQDGGTGSGGGNESRQQQNEPKPPAKCSECVATINPLQNCKDCPKYYYEGGKYFCSKQNLETTAYNTCYYIQNSYKCNFYYDNEKSIIFSDQEYRIPQYCKYWYDAKKSRGMK